MNISELTPDKALATAINGAIEVQISATKSRTLKAYCQSAMPNTGLADEFITVTNNGVIRSLTYPVNVFRGNLALTIYCKANSNGTAKLDRIGSILQQLQERVENLSYEGFYYTLNSDNVITPTYINQTTGYATTVVNVEWRTIN